MSLNNWKRKKTKISQDILIDVNGKIKEFVPKDIYTGLNQQL